MYYNLSMSQADRVNFDQMAYNAGTESLRGLDEKTAMAQGPVEYAEFSWDEWFDVEDSVDSVAEAKARYINKFAEAIKDWQAEHSAR